jgi:hypothetical protein
MQSKLILAGIAILFFICGCHSGSDKVNFSTKYLEGNWMVVAMYASNKNLQDLEPISVSSLKVENEILHIYHFNKDNSFVLDTGSIQVIKGTYQLEDTTITIKKNDISKFFTATQVEDSSMMMATDFPNDANGKLVYEFVKIKPNPNFDIADTKWKIPLSATATDDSIRAKLIATLKYYEGYYYALYESGATVFSQAKLCLPLKLYSGGVGLKTPAETKDFVTLMGSEENANKAVKMLRTCFAKSAGYPDRGGKYIIEYAVVFGQFAKELQKQN